MPGSVALVSHWKPSSTASESNDVSPTSQIAIRSSTMSPGITLPAVVSQNVPPPMVQLSKPPPASKPVPRSCDEPSEHELALTSVSHQSGFDACESQTANRLVPLAMLIPIGHCWPPCVYVIRFLSMGLAIGLGVPFGVSTRAMS